MNIEERNSRKTFDVPDGYFDKFHERMMQQLPQVRKSATTRSIFSSKFIRLGYAAVISLFIIGGASFIYNNSIKATSDDFSKDIIEDIINNYPIDDYTFYCYLTNIE